TPLSLLARARACLLLYLRDMPDFLEGAKSPVWVDRSPVNRFRFFFSLGYLTPMSFIARATHALLARSFARFCRAFAVDRSGEHLVMIDVRHCRNDIPISPAPAGRCCSTRPFQYANRT